MSLLCNDPTARKRGRNPGRPPLQPETISALQDLVEAGKSVSQAAKHLGIGRSRAYKVISETRQRQMFAESSPLEKFSVQTFRLGTGPFRFSQSYPTSMLLNFASSIASQTGEFEI